MNELALYRRFFADEIAAVAAISTTRLVDALADVPRERFLGPGPWLVRGDGDMFTAGARRTPDDDPRRVYHNYSIAIDPARQLFNGSPGFLTALIDKLSLLPGARVLHVGAGLGYYSALIGHTVGSSGRVLAIEVDETLARAARTNLAWLPWVEVRTGDGKGPFDGPFDAILVNAGVTHPQAAWLEALSPGGRMILPLTVSMPQMGTIGKGIVILVTRDPGEMWAVTVLSPVAIYSGIGLRDDTLNVALGQALRRSFVPAVRRLRRDAHAPGAQCWLHGSTFCLSLE
jgi:protein-L-isoaspartate(D-aspartate) O-methyltransferase